MKKQLTEEEFKEIYVEWKNSGLTKKDYCENSGVSQRVFQYWQSKLRRREKIEQGCFLPVSITRSPKGEISFSGNKSIRNPGIMEHSSNSCEIVYPNGVTLRLKSDMSLDALRTLISLYQ